MVSLSLSLTPITGFGLIVVSFLFVICILAFLVTMIWLMNIYRSVFHHWLGWATPILLLFICNFPVHQPIISAIQTVMNIASIVAMIIATVIMLYYRDVGLSMFGGISLTYIWSLVLIWQRQGDLLDLSMRSLSDLNVVSSFWFLNSLWCATVCITPLSILGFWMYTLYLLWKELHY